MSALTAAIITDPERWAGAVVIILGSIGAAITWAWRTRASVVHTKATEMAELLSRIEACETDRARLSERLRSTEKELGRERGRIDALIDMYKGEANLG